MGSSREKKILICPKMSKYEWDLHKYRISSDKLIDRYKKEKVDVDYILKSHKRQLKSRQLLEEAFSNATIVEREHLTREDIKNVDITIALGGDNHFQYVSHFIKDDLILGINSDSKISEGVLLSGSTDNIDEIKSKCLNEDYKIEKWTRLDVYINDEYVARAICDVFIGESERKYTSRQFIVYNGMKKQQKSSGILIATGSGSTGWFNSASRYLTKDNTFSRTSNYAKFIVTEPYEGTLTDSSLISGKIDNKLPIEVYSLNNNNGTVITDSLEEYSFSRGYTATVKVSNFPLNVIRFY